MFVGVLQLVGLLAAATTYLTLRGGLGAVGGRARELNEVAGGLVGMLLWLLVAYGAMNTQVATNGSVVSRQTPALAIFAALLAAISLGIGIWGTAALVDVRDVTSGTRR